MATTTIKMALFQYLDTLNFGMSKILKKLLEKGEKISPNTRREIQKVLNIRIIMEPNGSVRVEPVDDEEIKEVTVHDRSKKEWGIIPRMRKALKLTQQEFGQKVFNKSSFYVGQRERNHLWTDLELDQMLNFFEKNQLKFDKDQLLSELKNERIQKRSVKKFISR